MQMKSVIHVESREMMTKVFNIVKLAGILFVSISAGALFMGLDFYIMLNISNELSNHYSFLDPALTFIFLTLVINITVLLTILFSM